MKWGNKVNLFTIILPLITLFLMLKCKTIKNKYISMFILTCIIELNVNAGYMFKINNFEVSYSEFLILVLSVTAIMFMLQNGQLKKNTLLLGLGLLFSIILGLAMLIFLPSKIQIVDYSISWTDFFFAGQNKVNPTISMQSVKMLIRVFLFIISTLPIPTLLNLDSMRFSISEIAKYSKISILWGYAEWLSKNLIGSDIFNQISNKFFGVGSGTALSFSLRNNYYAILGFTREPSYFSETLYLILLLILANIILNNDSKKWFFAGFVLSLMSMSLSAIIFTSILLLFYFVTTNIKKSYEKVIVICSLTLTMAILSIVFLYIFGGNQIFQENYYFTRICNSINDISLLVNNYRVDTNITSEKIRLTSIVDTFTAFTNRPFLGIGIGTANSHSAVINILSNIGIIGVLMWISYLMKICSFKLKNKKRAIRRMLLFLIPYLFVGNISLLYGIKIIPILCGIFMIENIKFDDNLRKRYLDA